MSRARYLVRTRRQGVPSPTDLVSTGNYSQWRHDPNRNAPDAPNMRVARESVNESVDTAWRFLMSAATSARAESRNAMPQRCEERAEGPSPPRHPHPDIGHLPAWKTRWPVRRPRNDKWSLFAVPASAGGDSSSVFGVAFGGYHIMHSPPTPLRPVPCMRAIGALPASGVAGWPPRPAFGPDRYSPRGSRAGVAAWRGLLHAARGAAWPGRRGLSSAPQQRDP